jgi:hypothetical protein
VTAAELIDMVKLFARGEAMAGVTDGAILQALNVAQEDVSRNLRAPIQTVLYTNVNGIGALTWPTDARDDGILRLYALTTDDSGTVTASSVIPIYDFETASMYEPNWTVEEAADQARFVVYDPTYEIATPYPVPPPDADNVQSYRLTYVVRPTKMAELTDEPFNGRLESFHDILAYRAAYLMTRDNAMAAEYERRMREARGASNHGPVVAFNPLYTRNVVSSGRG